MRSGSKRQLTTQAFRFELDPNRAQGLEGRRAEVGLPALQEEGGAGLGAALRGQARGAAHPAADDREGALEGDLLEARLRGTDQLSSSLSKTKSVVVLEDLHVKGMKQNRPLALSISDAGLGELRRQLAYKSDWYGSRVIVADRFFPSSKTCSACAVIKDALSLSERVFACDACGLSLDRDENAAINLRRYGLHALGAELGIVPLPEGLREVTPDGEEGSGSTHRIE